MRVQLGADHVVNVEEADARPLIADLTPGGHGADVVYECSGAGPAAQAPTVPAEESNLEVVRMVADLQLQQQALQLQLAEMERRQERVTEKVRGDGAFFRLAQPPPRAREMTD